MGSLYLTKKTFISFFRISGLERTTLFPELNPSNLTASERSNWCFVARRIEFRVPRRAAWPTVVLVYGADFARTRCVGRSTPGISSIPTDIPPESQARQLIEFLLSLPRERLRHSHGPSEEWYVHRCSGLLYHPRVERVREQELRCVHGPWVNNWRLHREWTLVPIPCIHSALSTACWS